MSDEQIKDIVITLINKGVVYIGGTNEETAKEIATLINTLKKEISTGDKSVNCEIKLVD